MAGPLTDRFGRLPVLYWGLAGYTAAGIASAFAPTFGLLLVGRFVWGLTAAGPRNVSQAMLRDRFRGDGLSRAMAVIVTVFMILPAIAPALGQAALSLGSWRYTFFVGPLLALLLVGWATRAEETLDPEARRPLQPRAIGAAFARVAKTRTTLGNAISILMFTAAFLPYLGSSERIYDVIYDRGDAFFLFFALNAGVMAIASTVGGRLVRSFGTDRTLIGISVAFLMVATTYVVVAVATDGVPPFWAFFWLTAGVVSLNIATGPLLTSRALDEVGDIAGTAASAIGALGLVGATILSPVVDGAITDSVTPFAVGTLVFGSIGILAFHWADRWKVIGRG